ncbi:MAG TPA: hypothetical protein VGH87_17065, partial [Polyangiaceae bacterium]
LVVPPVVTVVVGESSTFDVDVSAFATSAPSLTITTSTLPDGVTCSSVLTSNTGTSHIILTLHASADAAISELPIDVHASSNGKIVASSPLLLDVSGVVGSLDPTFGDAGIMTLPPEADDPNAIGVMQDGTIVIAGFGASKVFVERFLPTAAPPAPWQSSVASSSAAAISSDGRVAIAMNQLTSESVIELDATNAIIDTRDVPFATALAWDGSGLFVATTSDLRWLGPNGDALVANDMAVTSLETTSPGSVLVAGLDTSDRPVVRLFTVNGATLDATPPAVLTSDVLATRNTVTTPKGTLVGLTGAASASVVRLDSQRAVVATYPLDARWFRMTEVLALPSGEPVVLGTSQLQMDPNNASLAGFIVGFDSAFGALGHTYLMGITTVATGAIDAEGKYLYVTGTKNVASQFRGWVARVRLTSTP